MEAGSWCSSGSADLFTDAMSHILAASPSSKGAMRLPSRSNIQLQEVEHAR